jgi:hypothetical protein
MGKQRSQSSTPATTSSEAGATTVGTSKKSITPPKGRPTRARNSSGSGKRAFGPIAQWATVALLVALIVVVLVLITDGGDFNPFDDEELPSQFGAPAARGVVVV